METPSIKDLQKTVADNQVTMPTLQDLFQENAVAIGRQEGLNYLLNGAPKKEWIKEHPSIPGWKYIAIDKVEHMMRVLFKKWNVEVLKTGMLMNAVEVTVRVHYLNLASNEMEYQDGVGAQELQTKKDTGALKMDMSNVNRGAVAMALPIAKSLAIKDACELIGNVFGGNLNRKDVAIFQPDMKLIKSNKEKLNGN